MQRSLVLLACLIAISAAISTWFWWPREVALPRYTDPNGTVTDGEPQPSSADYPNGNTSRIPVANGNDRQPGTQQRLLRVQLRGLHALAPWTAEIRLELQDRTRGQRFEEHNSQSPVTEDGKCTLALATWWQPGMPVRLRLSARNEGYRELEYRERGALALNDLLTIDVQAIASVSGQVTDTRGHPVRNARISAFAMRAGTPFGNSVGATGTDRDGNYRLLAPPDQRILLVATAMKPNVMMWRAMNGVNDSGHFRGDLLPVTRPVQLAVDHPGTACNFALPDAESITGKVIWPDDTPIQNARVRFDVGDDNGNDNGNGNDNDNGIKLSLGYNSELLWQPDGSVLSVGIADVDREGRFKIPTPPGATAIIHVQDIGELRIIGELPKQRLGASATAELMMPFPVTIRAIHRGQLKPHARVLVHGKQPHRAGPDGTSRVLIATEAMVRTELGPMRSPWQSIASSHLEQTVDMVMSNQLVEVQIEFKGKAPVRNALFTWKCQDGRQATERLTRGDNSGPFRLWLEPDNYTLRASAGPGERNGTYLLPVERTFSTRDTKQLTLPAEFGGTFKLQVFDERGRFMAGKCSVRGVDGKERIVHMKNGAKPGEFGAETSQCTSVLPPGPYELLIDVGGSGQHKRYVQIKALETTPVVLRL